MGLYDVLVLITIALTALHAFKTYEHALLYFLWINAIMITWAYNKQFDLASMHYVIPALSNTLIAVLISSYKVLSKPAYFLLIGSISAAIVNMISAVVVLFYEAGIIFYPASIYQAIMLIPLAVMICGFVKVGHGHYRRVDDCDHSPNFGWALHRFNYQKTA